MKTKLFTLFVAFIATTALWAQNNVITYTATEKLPERISGTREYGLYKSSFGDATCISHSFDPDTHTGTILFNKDITEIGLFAFESCSGLISITIPSSVTSIGDRPFNGCSGLTSVYISDLAAWCRINFRYATSNPLSYAKHLYLNNEEIKNLIIPTSITEIMKYAFYGCTGLTSLTIPNSVTTIGARAFDGCTGLTSVTIPNSVTTIGENAFYGCSSLTTPIYTATYFVCMSPLHKGAYTIPDGIKQIATHAFYGCSGLTSVTIPNSVTEIGYGAFSDCFGLTSVTIPDSVTTIGDYAFYNCTGLSSIIIGKSVTIIRSEQALVGGVPSSSAFEGCTNLKIVYNNSNLNITTGSTNYGYVAYYAEKVFSGIPMGDFVVKQDTIVTEYVGTATAIMIPNGIIQIGGSAFSGCTKLKSVAIPNSVTTIGQDAFYGCSGLTSVTIPNSVTTIGNSAFSGCTGLTSVTIPNSVKTIGTKAFNNVLNIVYHGSATGSPWGAKFFNCYVEDYLLYNDSTKTSLKKCISKTVTEVVIPNSVITIEAEAFCECSGLISITIPNSVTLIGNDAFEKCSNLTSVTIGNSVTTIGDWAFAYCSGLTAIEIPNSVTTIGRYAFCDCTNLASVSLLGNSLLSIKQYAFENCNKLKYVYYDDYFKYFDTYYFPKSAQFVCSNPITASILNQKMISASISIVIPPIYYEWYDKIWIRDEYGLSNEYQLEGTGIIDVTDLFFSPGSIGGPYASTRLFIFAKKGEQSLSNPLISVDPILPSLSCSTSSTQTTITISNISASTDESVNTLTKGVYVFTNNYDGKRYEADKNDCVILSGITPNKKCTLKVYGCYNGHYYYGNEMYVTTKSISPTITTSQIAPTSVYVSGSYTHDDATILSTALRSNSTTNAPQGEEGYFTGLRPKTKYTFTYEVNTKEGGVYSANKEITTPELVLTTQTPKVVAAGTAIVAAETNISDYETNVGFEWRKYDAPSTMPSKSGTAILCNGVMEGRLLNLGTDAYWNVRPYYEDLDGTRYYGEWITFDPSDFSYFEPTVHTYALATSPTSNAVQVRGYVMTGTDDVTEQGFEYWFNSGKKAPNRASAATADSVYRVTASGQVMTAVLEDLAYSTTYTCRAYAIAGGKTYYGEEVQFLTPEDPRPIYTLTVLAGENGNVNVVVSGQYREGEKITLKATPNEGYLFDQWSDGSTENPYIFTIMQDTEITASFKKNAGTELRNILPTTTATKYLHNGQLIIDRNGQHYSAMGERIR